LLGGEAFRATADGKNHFRGVETREVPGGFETHADVGAGHDDCLAGELFVWVWELEEEVRGEELPWAGGGGAGHGEDISSLECDSD